MGSSDDWKFLVNVDGAIMRIVVGDTIDRCI
jgi:hypothetical protein